MTDLTDEAVKALLDDTEAMRRAVSGEHTEGTFHAANWADKPHRVLYDCIGHVNVLARALLDARAENARLRADAQAAMALMVQKAARTGADAATVYWDEAKKPVKERKHGGSGLPGCVMKEILALADADGLAAVDALRKERDRFEAALGRACLVGGTTYLVERAETAIADRDRLAAANAALEARVARLVGAGLELKRDMEDRAQVNVDVIAGKEYRIVNAGNSAWTGFCAALAEVQADARREGGE